MGLPQALFLDFDGVVLESVDAKTQAMGQLFAGRPEHVEKIVRYHLDNAGVSRYDKFRHFYREYFNETLDDAQMARLDKEFSALVRRRVLTCAFVPGARELLERWSGLVPMHVVSATPEPELREIVRERGLSGFFRSVNGAPAKKAEHVARILEAEGLDPQRCFFVGDAAADGKAAAANGVPFVLRITPEAPREALELPAAARMRDLRALESLWAPRPCVLAAAAQPPSAARAAMGREAGGRWLYLGRSFSRRRAWERGLGERFERVDVAAPLHEQAAAARTPFLEHLRELAKSHGGDPAWWLSRLSDENTLSGSLFSDVCWLLAGAELLRGAERPVLIVAESEGILEALEALDEAAGRLRTARDGARRLVERLRGRLRWARFFAARVSRIRAARATAGSSRNLPSSGGKPLVLLHTCAGAGYFADEAGRDAYFGGLAAELERRGFLVAVLPWLNETGRSWREAFSWLRARARPHLVLDDFLTLADAREAAARIRRSASLPALPQVLRGLPGFPRGLDISPLVREAMRAQACNTAAADFALYRPFFEKAVAAGLRPAVFVDMFENSLTEKTSTLAVRSLLPRTLAVGFQHWASPPPLMLQHVAVPDPSLAPLPDAIVCNSPFTRELYAREGFPASLLRTGPSLRYPHLLGGEPTRRPEAGTVLVGFSLEPEACAELLDTLRAAFPADEGLRFWLKPHPQTPAARWNKLIGGGPLPAHMEVVSGPIAPWLERAACAVVGASTVSMDLALAGVPLVEVGRATALDFSPLAHFEGFPAPTRGAQALREAVLRAALLDEAGRRTLSERAAELRRRCLSPVTDDTIAAFTAPAAKETRCAV